MSRLTTRLQKLEEKLPVEHAKITVIHHLVEGTLEGPRIYGAISSAGEFVRNDGEGEEEFKLRVAQETKPHMEANE